MGHFSHAFVQNFLNGTNFLYRLGSIRTSFARLEQILGAAQRTAKQGMQQLSHTKKPTGVEAREDRSSRTYSLYQNTAIYHYKTLQDGGNEE